MPARRRRLTSADPFVQVLKHSPKYQVLATNKLDDEFDSSPAIAGDELYLRGRTHLYCIARK